MQLNVWDVFLLDPDFKIERPKRYYRQGLNIFHAKRVKEEVGSRVPRISSNTESNVKEEQDEFERRDNHTMKQKFDRMSKTLHRMHWPGTRRGTTTSPSSPSASVRAGPSRRESDGTELSRALSNSSTGSQSDHERVVDPSTNMDALREPTRAEQRNPEDAPEGAEGKQAAKNHANKDVSKHTFFITNSQMRLKCFAKSEVCTTRITQYVMRVLIHGHIPASNATMDYCARKDCEGFPLDGYQPFLQLRSNQTQRGGAMACGRGM